MDAVLDALHAVNLVFGMAAVGAALYEALVVIPGVRARPAREATEMLRTLRLSPHRPSYRYLPVSGLASGVAALAIVALWNEQPRPAAVLTAVGFLLFAGALVANLRYWGFAENRIYKLSTPVDDATLAGLATRNLVRTV